VCLLLLACACGRLAGGLASAPYRTASGAARRRGSGLDGLRGGKKGPEGRRAAVGASGGEWRRAGEGSEGGGESSWGARRERLAGR